MSKLTAKEFIKLCKTLPKEEQYKLSETLDPHEQFLLRTVYTIPDSYVVNEVQLTKEEREKAHQDLINILKENGIIQDESECEEID